MAERTPRLRALALAALLWLGAPHGAPAQEPPVAVSAAPGTALSLDAQVPPSPGEPSVLLEATLSRPGGQAQDDIRWLVAAAPGMTARVSWEFAYPWEVVPGVWTMRVSSDGQVIARADFDVTPGAPPAQAAKAQPAGKKAPAPQQSESKAPDAGQAGKKTPDQKQAEPRQPAKPDPAGQPSPGQSAAARQSPLPQPKAPAAPETRARSGPVTGDPARRLYVLVGGSYTEEARALWVSVFLEKRGVKACVREEVIGSRRLWAVITGWTESQQEAARMRASQAGLVGETILRTMSAGELSRGLRCP